MICKLILGVVKFVQFKSSNIEQIKQFNSILNSIQFFISTRSNQINQNQDQIKSSNINQNQDQDQIKSSNINQNQDQIKSSNISQNQAISSKSNKIEQIKHNFEQIKHSFEQYQSNQAISIKSSSSG